MVERVLSQNISHHKIGSFRGVDSIDFNGTVRKSETREERLEMLWQYQIEKTRGYIIKSIAWNQVKISNIVNSYNGGVIFCLRWRLISVKTIEF